ncbi:MAG TPA: hypothetical protein VK897_19535 [Anaerolineales bacterium]|nr:hypothetical protein [Anaerolineales bacterium]
MKRLSEITSFFAFPIIVLFAHLIASRPLQLYAMFPHLDIPFHYLGGLSIAYTSCNIVAYLERKSASTPLNKVIFLLLIFSLSATAAVF